MNYASPQLSIRIALSPVLMTKRDTMRLCPRKNTLCAPFSRSFCASRRATYEKLLNAAVRVQPQWAAETRLFRRLSDHRGQFTGAWRFTASREPTVSQYHRRFDDLTFLRPTAPCSPRHFTVSPRSAVQSAPVTFRRPQLVCECPAPYDMSRSHHRRQPDDFRPHCRGIVTCEARAAADNGGGERAGRVGP